MISLMICRGDPWIIWGLGPAQLSQWRWPELNITSRTLPMSQVKVSIHLTAGRPLRWALPRILVLYISMVN